MSLADVCHFNSVSFKQLMGACNGALEAQWSCCIAPDVGFTHYSSPVRHMRLQKCHILMNLGFPGQLF